MAEIKLHRCSKQEIADMRKQDTHGIPIFYCEETGELYPLPEGVEIFVRPASHGAT